MYLGEQTWPDLGEYFDEKSVALVPLGSTEQHGPHLPESTDHRIAEALARDAAERTGSLCTPTVTVGVSSHHRQFHGTMWVEPAVFRDYVESLTRNLTYHGIDRVVFVNAHGGNVDHLREVGRRLRDDRLTDARDGGIADVEAYEGIRQFGARTFYDAIDNTDNGVLGDQTDATREKGRRLFEAASDQLVHLLEWLDEQPFEELMPREHV